MTRRFSAPYDDLNLSISAEPEILSCSRTGLVLIRVRFLLDKLHRYA